ncbi:hypothetical protein ACFFX0_16895 [Citricoccus parietis]|uniref:Uncharacterized protein n=1 Tax=Citricoccus parietis TaxID=592307 RepID=A0ABV5G1I0_9MICC
MARPNRGASRMLFGLLPPREPRTASILRATSAAVRISGPRMATSRTSCPVRPSGFRATSSATSRATEAAETGAMRIVGRTATGPRVVRRRMVGTSSNHCVEWMMVTGSPEER